jgi:hypothetical protein
MILPDTDSTYNIGTQCITLTTLQHDKQKAQPTATASTSDRDSAIPATETVYENQYSNMKTKVRLVAIKREHNNKIKTFR